MLLLLLIALIAASLERTEASRRHAEALRCEQEASKALEKLASHYCRFQASSIDGESAEDYRIFDYESSKSEMLGLTVCAFGNYNFYSKQPAPLELTSVEALKMMKACTIQQAAYKFLINIAPHRDGISHSECIEDAYNDEIAVPESEAYPILNNLDMEELLLLKGKRSCAEKIMNSFAKEYVRNGALSDQPSEPDTIEWLRGRRLNTQVYKMSQMSRGAEWVELWVLLDKWSTQHITLKGWTLTYQSGQPLPVCTVYYETY